MRGRPPVKWIIEWKSIGERKWVGEVWKAPERMPEQRDLGIILL